jgi:hypothetical protein
MSLIDDAFALITLGSRQIGTLIPDVVVREAVDRGGRGATALKNVVINFSIG